MRTLPVITVTAAVAAALALSAGTARAQSLCDGTWELRSQTSVPAGCPIEIWMFESAPIYRWDGGVRGDAIEGTLAAENVRTFGVEYGCLANECSHHRRDYVTYLDHVRITLPDPPGATVALGDPSQALVELTITDAGGCPPPSTELALQCGDDPSDCRGCEDDGGCAASPSRRGGGSAPAGMIAVASLALAFVTRWRRQR